MLVNNITLNIMKTKEDTKSMVKVPESSLLSLVADKLKGRVLFPEKLESAKKHLSQITISCL